MAQRDDEAGEMEKGFVHFDLMVLAHQQATEIAQPGNFGRWKERPGAVAGPRLNPPRRGNHTRLAKNPVNASQPGLSFSDAGNPPGGNRAAHLAQRAVLNLAHIFAGDADLGADLLERARLAAAEAEAGLEHPFLARIQPGERVLERLQGQFAVV